MSDSPVTVERNDTVTILSLDRPAERNALSAPLADTLRAEVQAAAETETKALLLRGEGAAFCAGGDVSGHVARVEGDIDAEEWAERQERVADAVAAVYDCPLPTVAAVDGPAFSEGACLALACDIRLASPEGGMGFGFRRFGQAAAAGATYLLPRVVGPDTAAELLYTGELLDARAATRRGLLTRVVEGGFEDGLASLLSQFATGPAAALEATKRLCRADHGSLEAAMEAEREAGRRLAETADFEEGVTAFRQQRDPQF